MTTITITPTELAKELDVDPKRVRAYLRASHSRAAEAKGKAWSLPTDVADAVRENFAPEPDEA